jgi:glycosyltransferase involved in cell wall biosynthesis
LGRLDAGELADWLGRACIFALPARYEPFGLTPVQAALAGCALVLGDIDSLREVWGENADFVHPDDPAALRRRLEELLADEELRLQRAEAARQRALAYTVEAMAAKYMRRYRYMLGELSPAFSTTKETAT